MPVAKAALTISLVGNESLGQRKHKFTCYIKLLRNTRLVHSKASFSFWQSDLELHCIMLAHC